MTTIQGPFVNVAAASRFLWKTKMNNARTLCYIVELLPLHLCVCSNRWDYDRNDDRVEHHFWRV